jgi:triacylglycerol lipase
MISFLLWLLALLYLGVLFVVVLSYAIAWYEYANRDPGLLRERFSPAPLRLATWLLVSESLALFVTILLRPLAWLPPRTPRGGSGSGTPIILLHGLFHNRSCWWWLQLSLRRVKLGPVYALKLPHWRGCEELAELLATQVEEVCRRHGVEQVWLVGHSNGGMVARHYLQLGQGARRVAGCVMVAAPHAGSKLAPFAVSGMGLELLPGSPFLRKLAETPLPPLPMTAIYSRHDNIVIPFESGRLSGAKEVELRGLGHTAILYHPEAIEAIVSALRGENPETGLTRRRNDAT